MLILVIHLWISMKKKNLNNVLNEINTPYNSHNMQKSVFLVDNLKNNLQEFYTETNEKIDNNLKKKI